jgi:hypothetical protein
VGDQRHQPRLLGVREAHAGRVEGEAAREDRDEDRAAGHEPADRQPDVAAVAERPRQDRYAEQRRGDRECERVEADGQRDRRREAALERRA